jgi:hypothetical protein
MADAMNRRIHAATIDPSAPAVGVARRQQVTVGDIVVSRRSDPTIPVLDATVSTPAADPVRNGNRWIVHAVDPDRSRIAARRLDDNARTVFSGNYLTEHITYGYAVTVHSAQGVTADTAHAAFGGNVPREMLYVAMTRGRESNTAYVYERPAGETDHQHRETGCPRAEERGHSRQAARLIREIIGHVEHVRSAHDVGAAAAREHGCTPTSSLLDRYAKDKEQRRANYSHSAEQTRVVKNFSEQLGHSM